MALNFGIVCARKIVGQTILTDMQLQVVWWERAGAKDILLINWQAHPDIASTKSTPFGS